MEIRIDLPLERSGHRGFVLCLIALLNSILPFCFLEGTSVSYFSIYVISATWTLKNISTQYMNFNFVNTNFSNAILHGRVYCSSMDQLQNKALEIIALTLIDHPFNQMCQENVKKTSEVGFQNE